MPAQSETMLKDSAKEKAHHFRRAVVCIGPIVQTMTAAYGTVMFLLLEKFLPVLSKAFTTSKCDPEPMGTSVSIKVLLGEWNTSLKSR